MKPIRRHHCLELPVFEKSTLQKSSFGTAFPQIYVDTWNGLPGHTGTLPETNHKSTWKGMVGIPSFPFGARPIFRCYVSFREGAPIWFEGKWHYFFFTFTVLCVLVPLSTRFQEFGFRSLLRFCWIPFSKKVGKNEPCTCRCPQKNLSLKFVWPFSVQVVFYYWKKGHSTFDATQDVNETVNWVESADYHQLGWLDKILVNILDQHHPKICAGMLFLERNHL